MSEISQLQQALRDVHEVRRAIEGANKNTQPISSAGLQATRAIHLVGLIGALALLYCELFESPSLTAMLWVTAESRLELIRFGTVFLILISLLLLALSVYFIVWRNARLANEELSAFISRNFRYLSFATLTSDLFIKFSAVSLVILAQRPDWVASILIACTGDWLIQGRGFMLPVKLSIPLGFCLLVLAVVTLIFFEGYLYQALIPFIVASILSLLNVQRLMQLEKAGAQG
jgi:hypothetical protein